MNIRHATHKTGPTLTIRPMEEHTYEVRVNQPSGDYYTTRITAHDARNLRDWISDMEMAHRIREDEINDTPVPQEPDDAEG